VLIIIHAHYQLTAELWISIVLSLFKRIITISWPLLWMICVVDYHPCSWSTNSWIYIVLSVFERIITISWPLLWISCVDYHPWPWSTNSWIYIVLSLWISCVYYLWLNGILWPLMTSEAIEVRCFEVAIKRVIQLCHPKKSQNHTHRADLLLVHSRPLRPKSSQFPIMPIKTNKK